LKVTKISVVQSGIWRVSNEAMPHQHKLMDVSEEDRTDQVTSLWHSDLNL